MNTQHSMQSDRWFTPAWIVDLAHTFLGGAPDLDPASEPEANTLIKASRIITAEEDGLLVQWGAAERIFLNPPGGKLSAKHRECYPMLRTMPQAFMLRLIMRYLSSSEMRGVYVGYSLEQLANLQRVKNFTWMLGHSQIVIPEKRVAFLAPDGKASRAPTHSNFLLFVGQGPKISCKGCTTFILSP